MDKYIKSWDAATGENVTVTKRQQEIMKSQKVMVICCTAKRRTIKNLAMKKRLFDLIQQGATLVSNDPDFLQDEYLQDEYLAEFIDR